MLFATEQQLAMLRSSSSNMSGKTGPIMLLMPTVEMGSHCSRQPSMAMRRWCVCSLNGRRLRLKPTAEMGGHWWRQLEGAMRLWCVCSLNGPIMHPTPIGKMGGHW